MGDRRTGPTPGAARALEHLGRLHGAEHHGQPIMGHHGEPVPGRAYQGPGGGRHQQLRPAPHQGVRK